MNESIYDNICSLTKAYEKVDLKSSRPLSLTTLIPVPHYDKQQSTKLRRNLKRLAFETLLFGAHETQETPSNAAESFDPSVALELEFSEAIYDFRLKRQYDKANAFERNLEKLKTLQSTEESSFPDSILKLLLLLKHSAVSTTPQLEQISERIVETPKDNKSLFPTSSLMFGDSKYVSLFQTRNLEQFPALLFNRTFLLSETPSLNLLDSYPGDQLNPVWNPLSPQAESSQRSLFGALSNPPCNLLGTGLKRSGFRLDIPHLPGQDNPEDGLMPFNTLASTKSEMLMSDEGYVSPSPTPTKSSNSARESHEEPCDWQIIASQDFQTPCRRTWESLGQLVVPKELPHVSEAGPQAVSHLHVFLMSQLRLINPSFNPAALVITEEVLIWRHILLLCLGIPSTSFITCGDLFEIIPGLTIEGLTPDCMASWIQPFLMCGRVYRHLWQVAHLPRHAVITRDILINRRRGFVFQAFQDQVLRYVNFYQEFITNKFQNLNCSFAVRFIETLISPLRICYEIDSEMEQSWAPHQSVFSFLVLLLQKLELVGEKEDMLVLASILQACITPLVKFIENWAWRGICSDPHSEYWVQLKLEYLTCRNRRFWTHGFVLAESQRPLAFLKEFRTLTFECGKAFTLLKVLNPKHDMVTRVHVPSLDLVLTPEQCYRRDLVLSQYERYWTDKKAVWAQWKPGDFRKFSNANEIALKATLGRKATLLRIKESTSIRLKNMATEKRKKEAVVNSNLALSLAQKREAQNQEVELENLEAEKRAKVLEERDVKEQLGKAELVQKYAKLMEASEKREERAQWLARRRSLTEQREEFLRNAYLEDVNQNPVELQPSSVLPASEIANPNSEDVLDNIRCQSPVLDSKESGNIMTQSDIANQNFTSDPIWNLQVPIEDVSLETTANCPLLPREMNKRKVMGIDNGVTFSPIAFIQENSSRGEETVKRSTEIPAKTSEEPEFISQQVEETPSSENAEEIGEKGEIQELPKESEFSVLIVRDEESNDRLSSKAECQVLVPKTVREEQLSPLDLVEKSNYSWEENLHRVGEPPMKDVFQVRIKPHETTEIIDPSQLGVLPWSVLLEKSLLKPIKIQNKLVNRAVLYSLLEEHKLFAHFKALRSFLLMHEANFGDTLTSKLATHVELSRINKRLFIPALTTILNDAIASACSSEFSDNLSFKICHVPDIISFENSRALNFVTLQYLVTWPQNLILTDNTSAQYIKVCSFLLEIRYALWALSDIMQYLNHKGCRASLQKSRQYLQLHIARHKMNHFVRSFHMYLAHQLLDVQWEEFCRNVENKVECLEDLYITHSQYLELAITRCLLKPEAKPALDLLRQALTSILRFRRLLIESQWVQDTEYSHPRFDEMMRCHVEWQECAKLLFLVVQKLTEHGYSELQNLVLTLGFNNYYS